MVNLSKLIGLPVLNKSNATIEGYIVDVFFDIKCKKLAYFEVSKTIDGEPFKLLHYRLALAINDAVIIKAKTDLISISEIDSTVLQDKMLNKQIFSYDGIKKGQIEDVVIGLRACVKEILTSYGLLESRQILNNNEILFIKAQKRLKSTRRSPFSATENRIVHILDDSNSLNNEIKNQPIDNYEYYPDDTAFENIDIETAEEQNVETKSVFEKANIISVYHIEKQISKSEIEENNNTEAFENNQDTNSIDDEDILVNKNATTVENAEDTNNENAEIINSKNVSQLTKNEESAILEHNPLKTALEQQNAPNELTKKLTGTDCKIHNPYRIICDYDFLLGRKLQCNLNTYMGELIAPEGAIVTDELVEKARLCGKLVELTLNSK